MRNLAGIAKIGGFIRRLALDQRGNTLAIVAGALIPLIGIIGGGVDISRAYMVKARLQQACDAGVLAGRKAVGKGTFTTAARNQAVRFFNANYETGWQKSVNLVFTPTSPDNGRTVVGNASVRLPTVLMYIFGRQNIDMAVTCEASYDISNVDITLVLDTTGSMKDPIPDGAGGTIVKMTALRNAAAGFYDTMASATQGLSRTRYAFVPYTGTVNVGKLIRSVNVNYLDKTHAYESRVPNFTYKNGTTVVGYEPPTPIASSTSVANFASGTATKYASNSYGFFGSCAAAPASAGWTNSGSPVAGSSTTSDSSGRTTLNTSTQRQVQQYEYYVVQSGGFFGGTCDYYRRTNTRDIVTSSGTFEKAIYNQVVDQFLNWTYKRVNFDGVNNADLSAYIAGNAVTFKNGPYGTDASYTWGGCIEERDTIASGTVRYSGGSILPAGIKDLDIDAIPASSEDGWRPYFPEITYRRVNGSNNLTTAETTVAEPAPSYLKDQTSCPYEARLLTAYPTRSDFTNYLANLNPDGGTYHDIGMLWGARVSSPDGIFAANVNQTAGSSAKVSRHIIFMTDGLLDAGTDYYSAYGREFYARRVTADGSTDQDQRHRDRFVAVCNAARAKGIRVWVIAFATTLDSSLTECASPNSSFLSLNSTQLNQAFTTIAQSISDLRLTK